METMRRKDCQLTQAEGLEILEKAEYGVFSFIGINKYPHAIPMSFALDLDVIYFHSAMEGYKIKCMEESAHCCLTVVGQTQVLPEDFSTRYESCIVYGVVEELFHQKKEEALKVLITKYSPNFLELGMEYIQNSAHKTAVFQLKINHMSAKGRK